MPGVASSSHTVHLSHWLPGLWWASASAARVALPVVWMASNTASKRKLVRFVGKFQ